MKAVVCHETKLEVAEVPDPVPGPGQVLLEVVRGGICGSDLHARTHADQLADLASAIGYLDVMRPARVGGDGARVQRPGAGLRPGHPQGLGDGHPVVSLPMIRMGDKVQMTGLSAKAPGAYAERVLVQESLTMDVPNGLSPRDGGPDRADGGRLARRTPQRGAQARDRRGHRLRPDRAGRDPDAQGAWCAEGDRERLLARASRARRAVRRRRRDRPRRRVAVDGLRAEPLHHRRERPLRPRARHDGQAAQGAEAAVVAGAPRRRGRRRHAPTGRSCSSASASPGSSTRSSTRRRWRHGSSWSACAWSRTRSGRRWRSTRRSTCGSSFAYQPQEFRETLHLIADGKVDPTPLVTGTVGLDGVAGAFEALGDPERHAKILIDPASAVATV